MHYKSRGVTLIELLVVMSIIGILSFIAVPSYQNHLVKARMMEVMAVAEPYKQAMLELLVAGTPSDEIEAKHLPLKLPASAPRELIQAVSLSRGVLRVQSNGKRLGLSNLSRESLTLSFKPEWSDTGVLKWTCDYEPQDPKLHAYVPAHCQPHG